MKEYKFLIKPLFYIFNILFATWLVIRIEKLHPSDFGKTKFLFDKSLNPVTIPVQNSSVFKSDKQYLKNLFFDFKAGLIDSLSFDHQLDVFLNTEKKTLKKQ